MAARKRNKHAVNFKDITGMTFGKMRVISCAGKDKNNSAIWNCICECGTEKIAVGYSLRIGAIKSCGCYSHNLAGDRQRTHGHTTKGHQTKTYQIWSGMIARCRNPKHISYRYYGARGIDVCEHWLTFSNFLADMGEKPPGHSIERKDNDKNYTPDNCKWATRAEQHSNTSRNRHLTFNGMTLTLSQWARHLHVDVTTLHSRLEHWDLDRALTQKVSDSYKKRMLAAAITRKNKIPT